MPILQHSTHVIPWQQYFFLWMACSRIIVKVLLIPLFGSLCDLSLCVWCLFSGWFYFICPLQSILFASVLPLNTVLCLNLCFFPSRVVVLGIPSLHSLDSPIRQPSSLLHLLNPWKQCQKPTSLLVSIGWTGFARAYLCPALPARINSDLQVTETVCLTIWLIELEVFNENRHLSWKPKCPKTSAVVGKNRYGTSVPSYIVLGAQFKGTVNAGSQRKMRCFAFNMRNVAIHFIL